MGEGFYKENTPSSIANTDLITSACQHSNLVSSICKRGINNIETTSEDRSFEKVIHSKASKTIHVVWKILDFSYISTRRIFSKMFCKFKSFFLLRNCLQIALMREFVVIDPSSNVHQRCVKNDGVPKCFDRSTCYIYPRFRW